MLLRATWSKFVPIRGCFSSSFPPHMLSPERKCGLPFQFLPSFARFQSRIGAYEITVHPYDPIIFIRIGLIVISTAALSFVSYRYTVGRENLIETSLDQTNYKLAKQLCRSHRAEDSR